MSSDTIRDSAAASSSDTYSLIGRGLRIGSAVLASALVVGLSACGDSDEAALEGSQNQSSQEQSAVASTAAIRDNLAQLAADTAALKKASQTLIAKELVSEETRKIAQQAEPIFAEEEAQLVKTLGVDVDPSETKLDTATMTRLENEEGPHADMAYLTLMEGSLDKMLGQWEELEKHGGNDLQELARSSQQQLEDIQQALEKRMQY